MVEISKPPCSDITYTYYRLETDVEYALSSKISFELQWGDVLDYYMDYFYKPNLNEKYRD